MIRLFTTYYQEKREDRRDEYLTCLRRNLECAALGEVWVLREGGALPSDPAGRLRVVPCDARPTFSDFLELINRTASDDDISLIANTDVFLDANIRILEFIGWGASKCLALSRWDVKADGSARLFETADSQDCWAFRGKIRNVRGAFPVGAYDCDNKIAWELERAGYRVLNPSLSIRCYHLHLSGYRSYEIGTPPDFGIRPPFRYVEPDNLAGIWTCWRLYRKACMSYFPWRLTKKKVLRWKPVSLLMRVVGKVRRTLAAWVRPQQGAGAVRAARLRTGERD